jgi:hypothetical protein
MARTSRYGAGRGPSDVGRDVVETISGEVMLKRIIEVIRMPFKAKDNPKHPTRHQGARERERRIRQAKVRG